MIDVLLANVSHLVKDMVMFCWQMNGTLPRASL